MKVTVNGEAFDTGLDLGHVMMADALEIERLAGRRYVEWEQGLLGGSAEAAAVLACLAWKRAGRDVQLADILSGEVAIDFSELYASVMDALVEAIRARAAAENPTSGAEPLTAPDGTDMTPAGTRGSSPKS